MAVVTTSQHIMTAAYGKNKKNQPGIIVVEAAEGFDLVHRALTGLFQVAARYNYTYFGKQATVAYAGSGWLRPSDAELIYRLTRIAGGTRVRVVSIHDLTAAAPEPSVYREGQVFLSGGAGTDPTAADSIRFHYSKRPTKPANKDATLDQLWVEDFNELLILETAIYFAMKDNRSIEELKADRDKWLLMFLAHLEHETIGEVRVMSDDLFHANVTVPLNSILAGGTSVPALAA